MTALDAFLGLAWDQLERGVADRAAASRHPTLATLGRDGTPQARTLVLRAVDRRQARLEAHTDRASTKVAEIEAQPKVALHVWAPDHQLQIRMTALAEIAPGSPELWEAMPKNAQRVYGGTPAPGLPLATPDVHDPRPDPTRFCRILCHIQTLDLLQLGRDRHLRARFARADEWLGGWIAP